MGRRPRPWREVRERGRRRETTTEMEKLGSQRSWVEEACGTACTVSLDNALAKASEDGRLITEFVEKVAVMEEEARENMLEHYSKTLPRGRSLAKKEMGLKWMVEKRMEKNEEMTKDELMGYGPGEDTSGPATANGR